MSNRPPAPGPAPESIPVDVHDPRIAACIDRYWRKNILVMLILLAIWAFAGLGLGVLLADRISAIHLAGFPLGFWFAQQGSIITFVLCILAYCLIMNRLDATHHAELDQLRRTAGYRDDEPEVEGTLEP